jgi:hypothetical protein
MTEALIFWSPIFITISLASSSRRTDANRSCSARLPAGLPDRPF